MSEIAKKKIERLKPSGFGRDGSQFCVDGVWDFDPEGDPKLAQRRDDLLEGVRGYEEDGEDDVYTCNIGGCDRQIEGDPAEGPGERTGTCRAAAYCLKRAFRAIGEAETSEQGRVLHGDIIAICGIRFGGGNAGSLCPRLDCGGSAGVSQDMVPGTDGECALEHES